MTGVIYARYSSDNQREESIEVQLRECKAFAEKNDIQIVDAYIDRALLAKTDNRPSFQKMVKDSVKSGFQVIIAWKLDRFARNRYDSAHYKSLLRKNGVKVISATETISEGAEGILLESMLEGMAEYYSVELAEKTLRGMKENALACKSNGGLLPIGYVADENLHYQIDPVLAPVVVQAFTRYLEGATIKEITKELNAKGVRSKRGKKISENTVSLMLHNRKYIGEYRFRDVVVPNGIPAIVPKELFDRVQERLAANKKAPAKHKAEDEYLLTTKLFCGKCKCMMAGESGTSQNDTTYRYYKCPGVKYHRGCDKKTVRKVWIEDLVIQQIKAIIFDDDLIERLADMVIEVQEQENTIIPVLQRQLAEVEKGIENMLNAIQQGIITPSTKQRMDELEMRKNQLIVQLGKEEIAKPSFTKDQIVFWFQRFRKLDTKKLEYRRRLIDSFINAIFLYDDKMVITFNYKDGAKTVTFADLEKSEIGSDITCLGEPDLCDEIAQMPKVLDLSGTFCFFGANFKM